MGHGGEAFEGEEGGLVVEIEGKAGEQRELGDVATGAHLHDLGVDGWRVFGVEGEHKGQGEEEGKDGHHGVGVLGSESLGPGFTHDALGHDVLEGGGLVGKRGGDESGPGEGEFLEGGEADTTDDGDEGGVDHGVVDVAEEDRVGAGGEDGLGGLDDLTEGHGAGAQGKHGEGVGQRGPQTYGRKLFPVLHRQLRRLADAEEPLRDHKQHTDSELYHNNVRRKETRKY